MKKPQERENPFTVQSESGEGALEAIKNPERNFGIIGSV